MKTDDIYKKLNRDWLNVKNEPRVEMYLVEKVRRILPMYVKVNGKSYEKKYMTFMAQCNELEGWVVYGNKQKVWTIRNGLMIENL